MAEQRDVRDVETPTGSAEATTGTLESSRYDLPPGRDWFTLPNLITALRFLLLVPVCVMLVRGGPDPLAVILLLVWALTDWVDGQLARLLHQRSRTGEIIDPIADRIGVVGVVLALALAGLLPWPALVVLVAVDALTAVLAGRAAASGSLSVSYVGKARTAVLMTSVFVLAGTATWRPDWVPVAVGLLWVGVVLHVVAGIGYIRASRS